MAHTDGTFDTYTPAQYREKFNAEPIIEEEEEDSDIIIDATGVGTGVVVTQEVLDENPFLSEEGLKVGDIGVVTEEGSIDFSANKEEVTSELTQE